MIAIARTLATASRRCHPAAADQVCKRSVTSMSVFSTDNRSSHYICRNHSYDVIGMYHNIDIRLRPNDRCHRRRFASRTAQQQKEDEEDEYSVDEIDKEEADLMAKVHEANERCVLICCSAVCVMFA